jgi:hypothetical protein
VHELGTCRDGAAQRDGRRGMKPENGARFAPGSVSREGLSAVATRGIQAEELYASRSLAVAQRLQVFFSSSLHAGFGFATRALLGARLGRRRYCRREPAPPSALRCQSRLCTSEAVDLAQHRLVEIGWVFVQPSLAVRGCVLPIGYCGSKSKGRWHVTTSSATGPLCWLRAGRMVRRNLTAGLPLCRLQSPASTPRGASFRPRHPGAKVRSVGSRIATASRDQKEAFRLVALSVCSNL